MLRDFLASLPKAGLGLTLAHIQCLSMLLARSLSKRLSFFMFIVYISLQMGALFEFSIYVYIWLFCVLPIFIQILLQSDNFCMSDMQHKNTRLGIYPRTPLVCTCGDTL